MAITILSSSFVTGKHVTFMSTDCTSWGVRCAHATEPSKEVNVDGIVTKGPKGWPGRKVHLQTVNEGSLRMTLK